MNFLIVPTLAFERLFVFVILGLGRRRLLWIGVTTNPTAEFRPWGASDGCEADPEKLMHGPKSHPLASANTPGENIGL